VSNRLQNLHSKELDRMRKAFIKNSHTRLLKSFSCHLPFGTKDAYIKEIVATDLDKFANLKGDLRVPHADKSIPVLASII